MSKLEARIEAETPIRELNFPRMAAGLAVGRDPGSLHLRTVRGP